MYNSVHCLEWPLYSLLMSAGKTAEEIRKTFNIKNDFTPEEEEQVIMAVYAGI